MYASSIWGLRLLTIPVFGACFLKKLMKLQNASTLFDLFAFTSSYSFDSIVEKKSRSEVEQI